MQDQSSSTRTQNHSSSMLTPPTPRADSFSQLPNLHRTTTTKPEPSQDGPIAATSSATTTTTATRVTPPSTSSPLKRPREIHSPESTVQDPHGITSFATADPPVFGIISAPPTTNQTALPPAPPSTTSRPPSRQSRKNVIVHAIRELGYVAYLQAVNDPRFLPARRRPAVAASASLAPTTRNANKNRKRKVATAPSQKSKPDPSKKPIRPAPTTAPTAAGMETIGQTVSRKRKALVAAQRESSSSKAADQSAPSASAKRRRLSEPAHASRPGPDLSPQQGLAEWPSSLSASATASDEEWTSKKTKPSPAVIAPTKPTPTKSKNKKSPKKLVNSSSTTKPEKSRTKEQRWGDYLKGLVGGEKDVYDKLPDAAIPDLGSTIDHTPVRPYAFNKGKVQDYGHGGGLHPREMELAREVGLSYNAYRQQKRMAFIGYAAMQLEGKKEFKKSHTQSMCNIDGNKATHLWVHFHDVWGWMAEHPHPPITTKSLGGLQLPDLHPV